MPLLEALRSGATDAARTDAARRLGKQQVELPAGAVSALAAALREDPSLDVRCEAARALGRRGGPAAVPALVQALQDEDAVAMWAAQALGRIGDRDAVPALAEQLRAQAWGRRAYAADALGQIRHRSAAAALVGALGDPVRAVHRAALSGLRDLASADDRPAIEARLADLGPLRRRAVRRLLEGLR